MEEKVITYLKEKYNPHVIVLHGSRATGHERPSSDWDLIIFGEEKGITERDLFERQNLEISFYKIDGNEMKDPVSYFGAQLQYAKVLHDTDNMGQNMVTSAQAEINAGLQLTEAELKGQFLKLVGRYERMQDDKENQMIFFKHISDFYLFAYSSYFRHIKQQYSKPIYIGLPQMKEENLEYYAALEKIAGQNTSEEKITASKKILDLLSVVQKETYDY